MKVAYTPMDQDALISRIFDYIRSPQREIGRMIAAEEHDVAVELVRPLLSGLAASLKHPKFEAEQEVRLIVFKPDEVTPKFRGSVRGVMPYLEVTHAIFPNMSYPTQVRSLPIAAIRIGPPRGDAMEQRERSVRILLDSTGRKGVPVSCSEIPYIP